MCKHVPDDKTETDRQTGTWQTGDRRIKRQAIRQTENRNWQVLPTGQSWALQVHTFLYSHPMTGRSTQQSEDIGYGTSTANCRIHPPLLAHHHSHRLQQTSCQPGSITKRLLLQTQNGDSTIRLCASYLTSSTIFFSSTVEQSPIAKMLSSALFTRRYSSVVNARLRQRQPKIKHNYWILLQRSR